MAFVLVIEVDCLSMLLQMLEEYAVQFVLWVMVRVGVSEFGMEILKHIKSGIALLSDTFDVVVEVVNFRVHSASKNVGLVVEGSPSWQAV